jgi:hypothetical protein
MAVHTVTKQQYEMVLCSGCHVEDPWYHLLDTADWIPEVMFGWQGID